MPRVASYTIIADAWTAGPRLDFEVPAAIVPDSRCILTFMLDPDVGAEASVEVLVNGVAVWHWTFPEEAARFARFYQEVIPAGLVVPGSNRLELRLAPGTTGLVLISDVVLWWQSEL